jgi:hypothetical protein
MESRKRSKRVAGEERGKKTTKRDGCQNGEHAEQEWGRGKTSR